MPRMDKKHTPSADFDPFYMARHHMEEASTHLRMAEVTVRNAIDNLDLSHMPKQERAAPVVQQHLKQMQGRLKKMYVLLGGQPHA